MADRLTQLQDCLDQLLDLMYTSTAYIQQRHPYSEIAGQPQAPEAIPSAPVISNTASQPGGSLTNGHGTTVSQSQQPNGTSQAQAEEPAATPGVPPPEHSDVFATALRDLAQAVVLKEQQAELLINSLPGLNNSQADQEKSMRELEAELRELGVQRARAEEEREGMIDVLGEMIGKVKRVP